MNKSIFIAIVLSLSLLSVAEATKRPKGDLIGYSVDISRLGRKIKVEDLKAGPIITHTYLEKSQNEDDFVYPKNLMCSNLPSCELQVYTKEITNTHEYSQEISKGRKVNGGFKFFRASRSKQVKSVTKILETNQASFVHSRAGCSIYQCRLDPYFNQSLHPSFLQALKNLPSSFTVANRDIFFDFFETYGTHIISDATFGGEASQTVEVSSQSRETMKSNGVSIANQASIEFKISIGRSKSSDHSTNSRTSFKSNTQVEEIECTGGDPWDCPDWKTWSQTIANNPVPIIFTLESFDKFLSKVNLEGTLAGSSALAKEELKLMIMNRVSSIEQAIEDFYNSISESLPPSMFASDATRNGVASHMTSIPIGGKGKYEESMELPQAISINFATTMERNNATFYLTDWQISQLNAFSDLNSVLVKSDRIEMQLMSSQGLWSFFDASISRWTTMDKGFWVPSVIYAKPLLDSGYQYVTRSQQVLTMLTKIQDIEKINFISVSFADSPAPTEFYPLTSRYCSNYNLNPVSMHFDTINSDTGFYIQMQNQPVFTKWDYKLGLSNFNSGYFRVIAYNNVPDYDSAWVSVEAKSVDNTISMIHGLGTVPALVQCFFSPYATMKLATPLIFYFHEGNEFNPTSIRFNAKTIQLEMRNNGNKVFSRWSANTNSWTDYQSGYFRCVAYKSTNSFDNFSTVQKLIPLKSGLELESMD